MLVRRMLLIGLSVYLLGLSPIAAAQCKKASENDKPHGANELIIQDEGAVGRVRGKVYFPTATPEYLAEDIVVELYQYPLGYEYSTINIPIEHKRLVACLTGPDGKFSFQGVRPGKYILRLGTRQPKGINEVHVIFTLKQRPWSRQWLEVVLRNGT